MSACSSIIWERMQPASRSDHGSLADSVSRPHVDLRRNSLWLRLAFVWLVSLLGSLGWTRSAVAAPSPIDHTIERAAIETAELGSSVTRSLRLRMHLAQLLPQLRVTFGRGWQLTTSRDYLLETPQTDNDRVNYALSASWDLARLLSPHGELSLLKEEQARAQLRHRLIERVAQLTSERCVLLHRQRPLSPSDEQRRQTIETTLSVLTGGRFHPAHSRDDHCPAPPEQRVSATHSATKAVPRPASDDADSVEDMRPTLDPDRITDE